MLKTILHYTLKAWQTSGVDNPDAEQNNLLSHYASIISENAMTFKDISYYMVADAYFSKKVIVDTVLEAKLHFISRLRDDSVLIYKYYGEPTGKRGRPRKVDGTDLTQEGMQIVRYYRSRFQIEFLYRDAKQHTGLNDCQARSKKNLIFTLTLHLLRLV